MLRQLLFLSAGVVVFGIALPLMKGFGFLDPLILLGYACLGLVFTAPAAVRVFDGAENQREKLGRVVAVAGYGWAISILLLGSGIIAANLRSWQGRAIMPSTRFLLAIVLLGGAASLFTGAAAAGLGDRFGARKATTIMRIGFLLLLLALAFGARFLPEAWRDALDAALTTSGLTRLSFRLAAFFFLAGLGVVAAVTARGYGKSSLHHDLPT